MLSYDHDPAITEVISASCHLRVVWGGDYTINQIYLSLFTGNGTGVCQSLFAGGAKRSRYSGSGAGLP